MRLALLFALGTILVLAAAGGLFYLQLHTSLQASLDTSLQARVDALRTRLAVPGTPLQTAASDGGPVTQVIDTSGRVLASSPVGTTALVTGERLRRARAGSILLTAVPDDDEVRLRMRAGPVTTGSGLRVVLVVASPTTITDKAEDRVRDVMVLACGPMVLLSGLAAWVLSGAALRPVERMRRQAAAVGVADTGGRLEVPKTRDEIAALARTLNDLLDRLASARARDRAFVADAGHELRTPLTVLKAELELASRPGRDRRDLAEAVAGAAEETDRLIRLAEALLALARFDAEPDRIHREPVRLADLLDRAAGAAEATAAARAVRLRVVSERAMTVDVDPDRVRQAVDNLLANAVRHAPPGTRVEVRAALHPAADASRPGAASVVIEVRDQGPGFPPAFLPRAFDRFSRADDARGRSGGGAGLGLAIVAAIARAHGGAATAGNDPDGGAVVTVRLALERPHARTPADPGS
jgi:heavy metal sensor kinase